MSLSEPLEVALIVAAVLDDLGVEHLVGGSVASSLHGIPRATQDVDFVADLRAPSVPGLVERLRGRFYVDADAIADAVARRASFNAVHLETMLKADVFVLRGDPFSREEMRRRAAVRVDAGRELWVASAEDVTLHKLTWYRDGGEVSDRQWSDALGVLKVGGAAIDLAYLRRWAPELGVAELLERLLADADMA